jgi:hypothetical protein
VIQLRKLALGRRGVRGQVCGAVLEEVACVKRPNVDLPIWVEAKAANSFERLGGELSHERGDVLDDVVLPRRLPNLVKDELPLHLFDETKRQGGDCVMSGMHLE